MHREATSIYIQLVKIHEKLKAGFSMSTVTVVLQYHLSLAGTATNIIFVVTKVLLLCVCHDKTDTCGSPCQGSLSGLL